MDDKRVKEVFADEVFVKKLLALETPEEAQAALAEKGIEFSREEILGFRDMLMKALEKTKEGGELSLDDLEEVAGGVMISAAAAQVVIRAVPIAVTTIAAGAAAAVSFLTRVRW